MFKVIHTADFHIDNQNIDEAQKCLEFIIKRTKIEQPDIVMIAGDLFDSRNVKLESPAAMLLFDVITQMANFAPVAIVYGTPSHEGDATATLRYLKAKHPIHVSDKPEQYYMMNDNSFVSNPGGKQPKLIISAIPQPTKQYFKSSSSIDVANQEIASAMTNIFAGFGATAARYKTPHILMGHFSVSGAAINDKRQMIGLDIEISNDQIALTSADLVALGHIHIHQKVGNNGFYSGSIFPTDWGELEDKGFYIHTLENKKLIESNFIKTPSRKLVKLSEDFTGAGMESLTKSDIENTILNSLPNIKDAHINLEFKVFQDEAQRIAKEEIEETLIDMGAKSVGVHLLRMPRENVRSQSILKLITLREKVIEWANLRGETVPESILNKADLLESEDADKIIQEVAAS
jgi:exonuclease SbcD